MDDQYRMTTDAQIAAALDRGDLRTAMRLAAQSERSPEYFAAVAKVRSIVKEGMGMPEIRMVHIGVFSGEQYDGEWPTPDYGSPLEGAIAWFQSKLAEVPAKYRDSAKCHISSAGGYEGSHYGRIEIWYERPETAQETAQRVAAEQAKAEGVRDKELATLRALQAKYPKGCP